jgi:hypothetical protein
VLVVFFAWALFDMRRALGVCDDPPVERIDWYLEVDADATPDVLAASCRPPAPCIRNPTTSTPPQVTAPVIDPPRSGHWPSSPSQQPRRRSRPRHRGALIVSGLAVVGGTGASSSVVGPSRSAVPATSLLGPVSAATSTAAK